MKKEEVSDIMFDELRIKSILKKELSKEEYLKLPSKIKKDSRVINHFLSLNKNNINYIPISLLSDIVKNNLEFIEFLESYLLNQIFENLDIQNIKITYELIKKLNGKNNNILLKNKTNEYLNCLPLKELESLISENITNNNNDTDYKLTKEQINNYLNNTNEEVLKFLINSYSKIISKYVIEVIKNMSLEKQINLCKEDAKFIDYVDIEAKVNFEYLESNNDLEKILTKSLDAQKIFFQKNKEMLRYVDADTLFYILSNTDITINIEQLLLLITSVSTFNPQKLFQLLRNNYSPEDLIKFYSCYLNEFARFYINREEDPRKILKEIAKNFPEKQEKINKLINGLDEDNIRSGKTAIVFNNLFLMSRLLLNKKIINNNDIELLSKYSESFDNNILIDILVNTYGEHVREIFRLRPNLDIFSFYSFDILDKSILDNLGMNFINIMLSFNYNWYLSLISIIANDKEEMKKFKKYYDFYLNNKNKVDITDLTRILSRYGKIGDLINSLDLDNLSEIEKYNLELLTVDSDLLIAKVNSNNLKDYLNIRREYYKEKFNDNESLKNNIFEYLTGRNVNIDKATIDNMNLRQTIEVFNINNILKDETIIQKMQLTEDEVALLFLLNKINYINNEEVLKDLYNIVINCKYISPILFRNTFDKIQNYYTNELKENLISSDKLDKMKRESIDGVDVIKFEGQPYNMLCSTTELYLSDSNLHFNPLLGQSLLHDWLNREEGRSTISCALACDGISIHPFDVKTRISFVFDSSVSIIAMGGSDISVSHNNGDNNHRFSYIGYNKMRFASLDEMKNDMQETKNELDSTNSKKFTSEIVIPRYDEDLRKDVLKRTMPIGIYVEGEITSEIIETAKVFNEYYQKHGLGKFRIIQVDKTKYYTNYYPDKYDGKQKVEINIEWLEEVTEPIRKSGR